MAVVESHLHEGRVRAGIGRVRSRKTRRDADVGDDDLEVLRRHDFAHDFLHLTDQLIGQFQPRAGRRLDIDDELAGIGARKVGLADQRIQAQTQNENARDAEDRGHRPQQARCSERLRSGPASG